MSVTVAGSNEAIYSENQFIISIIRTMLDRAWQTHRMCQACGHTHAGYWLEGEGKMRWCQPCGQRFGAVAI